MPLAVSSIGTVGLSFTHPFGRALKMRTSMQCTPKISDAFSTLFLHNKWQALSYIRSPHEYLHLQHEQSFSRIANAVKLHWIRKSVHAFQTVGWI